MIFNSYIVDLENHFQMRVEVLEEALFVQNVWINDEMNVSADNSFLNIRSCFEWRTTTHVVLNMLNFRRIMVRIKISVRDHSNRIDFVCSVTSDINYIRIRRNRKFCQSVQIREHCLSRDRTQHNSDSDFQSIPPHKREFERERGLTFGVATDRAFVVRPESESDATSQFAWPTPTGLLTRLTEAVTRLNFFSVASAADDREIAPIAGNH